MLKTSIRWGLASCLSATVLTGCANIAHVTGAPPATTVKALKPTTRVRQFIGKNRQFHNATSAFIGVSASIF